MARGGIGELYRLVFLSAVLILATSCQTDQLATKPKVQTPVADVWQGFPEKIKKGLSGVGLVTNADYTKHGGAVIYNGNKDEDLELVLKDGWSHLTFYVALDPYFVPDDYRLQDIEIIRPKFENLHAQILKLSKEFPAKVFVLVTKARRYVEGPGERHTYLGRAFENSEDVRKDYANMWKFIAETFSDIPSDTLVFSIMNEPEFHDMWSGKNTWAKYSMDIISDIRSVTPDRVILQEGIHKSYLGRAWGTDSIMPVLPTDRIVYGFHFHEPYNLTHPATPLWQKWEKATEPCGSSCSNLIEEVADSMVDFSKDYGVPVMLTEFGAYGPYFNDKGEWIAGWTAEYRADWASKIYELTVPRGVGVTWHALHDYNTPYIRELGQVKMQKGFRKDELLWKALRLR